MECVITEKLLDANLEGDLSKDDIDSKVITNNSNNRSSSYLVRQGIGLVTVIRKINKDALGQQIDANMKNKINRLRIWDTRSQLQNPKERNLYTAFMQLQRLNDDLGLPDSVIEKAVYIYKKIQQNKITNGISIKIVIASALYIACRELDIPRTLKEISAISNTDEK